MKTITAFICAVVVGLVLAVVLSGFVLRAETPDLKTEPNAIAPESLYIEMSPEGKMEFRVIMAAMDHLKTKECVGRPEIKSLKNCGPVDFNTGRIMVLRMPNSNGKEKQQ